AAPGLRRRADAGIAVGVVSSLPEPVARWALRRVGLTALTLLRHGDEPAELRLPSRAGFRAACESLGVPPAETVFVGDLFWSDVRAAARAGLPAVLWDRYDRFSGVEARRLTGLAALSDLRPEVESVPPDVPGPESPGT